MRATLGGHQRGLIMITVWMERSASRVRSEQQARLRRGNENVARSALEARAFGRRCVTGAQGDHRLHKRDARGFGQRLPLFYRQQIYIQLAATFGEQKIVRQ
jgi:hypothetical protein